MGITYNEDDISTYDDVYVYAVIVVPDGRIISHRTVFEFSEPTNWCSTVCRRMVDEDAERVVYNLMWTKFELDTLAVRNGLTKLLSFYTSTSMRDRLFEIYKLDLGSGVPLTCSGQTEIKLLPLSTIIDIIKKNKQHGFTRETEHVLIALQDSKKLE